MKNNCCDCCYPQMTGSETCGCCEGVEIVTPLLTYNRPGLPEVSYRIGTHGSFMETMIARLTTVKGLTTRNRNDPSLALLDAWSTVADVLTFYQERIANEGYLRTATERRSVQELGKLVGYRPRPGVSSSVFLAYTLDDNHKEETVIPTGSRVQSIPGPDELPQTFETKEDLKARAQWNYLKPRMTKPQTMASIRSNNRLYLKGINTNLKVNEPLLIRVGDGEPELFWIKEIQPDAENDKTLIELIPAEPTPTPASISAADENVVKKSTLDMTQLITRLTSKPSATPASSLKLSRDVTEIFDAKATGKKTINTGEASQGVMKALAPQLQDTLAPSLANATIEDGIDNKITIYAMRVQAAPFAHNAPLQPERLNHKHVMQYKEWDLKNPQGIGAPTADFEFIINGLTVTFFNRSREEDQIDKDNVSWDFGDGNTSTEWSPEHTYESEESFVVTLTVINISGSSDDKKEGTVRIFRPVG